MTKCTAELWLGVVGWEDLYQVSDLGRVFSLRRQIILKASIDEEGRRRVVLCRDTIRRTLYVCHLVLEAFTGLRPAGCTDTRHRNGDASDDRWANLVWGTHRENMLDRIRHGTDRNVAKTHCPKNHPYSGVNLYIHPTGRRVCRRCNADRVRDKWRRDNWG